MHLDRSWVKRSDLLETSDRLLDASKGKSTGEIETASMGKSQSKLARYDRPVFCQMRKHYGQKCVDIEKLIKYHDFPSEGTLSATRLK